MGQGFGRKTQDTPQLAFREDLHKEAVYEGEGRVRQGNGRVALGAAPTWAPLGPGGSSWQREAVASSRAAQPAWQPPREGVREKYPTSLSSPHLIS